MLIMFCIFSPILAGLMMGSGPWAIVFSFVSTLSYWGTNYIAAEIESPFGDDKNDLPLARMQEDINASIWTMLEVQAQRPPSFKFDKQVHRYFKTRKGSFSVVNGEEVVESVWCSELG